MLSACPTGVRALCLFTVLLTAGCGGGAGAPDAADGGAGSGNESTGASSAEAPRFMGQPPAHYIEQLAESEDSGERVQAVAALNSFGAEVDGVVPALIGALADGDTLVRVAANRTLGDFGPAAAPALADALGNDPSAEVRAGAALALGNSVGSHEVAVPALAGALQEDTDLDVRVAAARGLSVGGAESAAAIPALVAALEDPATDLAQWAALALGRMGPAAASAAEALERAAESGDRTVANAASAALRRVRE